MYRKTEFGHGTSFSSGRALKQISFARWPSRLDFAIGYTLDFPVRLDELCCVNVFELAYRCESQLAIASRASATSIDVAPAYTTDLRISLIEDGRIVRRWAKEFGHLDFVVLLFQFAGNGQLSDLVDDSGMVIVCSHVVVREVSDFTGFGVS